MNEYLVWWIVIKALVKKVKPGKGLMSAGRDKTLVSCKGGAGKVTLTRWYWNKNQKEVRQCCGYQ